MTVSTKTLLEFAHELHRVIEDFEEELEILANQELMSEFESNEAAFKDGKTKTFTSIDSLKKELGA